jgi:hypothetical protein
MSPARKAAYAILICCKWLVQRGRIGKKSASSPILTILAVAGFEKEAGTQETRSGSRRDTQNPYALLR